jgi:hypothetical protein
MALLRAKSSPTAVTTVTFRRTPRAATMATQGCEGWEIGVNNGINTNRTTVTTRTDTPVPRRRSKKKAGISAGAVILIVIALFIALKLANQNQQPTVGHPVAARGH